MDEKHLLSLSLGYIGVMTALSLFCLFEGFWLGFLCLIFLAGARASQVYSGVDINSRP